MIAGAAMNIIHMIDRAAADAVHSKTSYSNAMPSGSFSSNHFSAASTFANTFALIGVADLFGRVDVNEYGHRSLASLRRPQCGSFLLGIELPNVTAVQGLHHADPGEHVGPRDVATRINAHHYPHL